MLEVAFHPLASLVAAALDGPRQRRKPLDVGGAVLGERIKIAPVEGVHHSLGQLHVRLRHRLPPLRREAIGAGTSLVDVGVVRGEPVLELHQVGGRGLVGHGAGEYHGPLRGDDPI